jgi:hypothetical protein
MLTAVLKAVKMLLSCCPNKTAKMLRKTTPTKTKYKDLFPSGSTFHNIYFSNISSYKFMNINVMTD